MYYNWKSIKNIEFLFWILFIDYVNYNNSAVHKNLQVIIVVTYMFNLWNIINSYGVYNETMYMYRVYYVIVI